MAEGPLLPREYGRYLGLAQAGMEMVVPIALGVYLDHTLGWTPWLTIAGAVLGFAGGLTHMILIVNRLNQNPPTSRRGPE